MTNLLRKLFIKDFDKVENPEVRKKHGYLASAVGIFTNLFLFIFKILIGLIIYSMSIISDAINNLTDMASCFVNLFGFKLAGKPADKDHPYGHERIEYLAGLIICFIMIALACILGYSSINKIINKEITNYKDTKTIIATFTILIAAILIKLWQGLFYKKMGQTINSVSLKANSQDSINDVISTSAVLVATLIEYLLREKGILIDGWMGLAVALFIVIMGIKTAIETADPLIGVAPDHDFVTTIINDIESYKNVLGTHDMMCHAYGPTKIFMTIHVEIDYKMDILEAHDLMDRIESEIGAKYNILLTVHMDPLVTDSKNINGLKHNVEEILERYDKSITFHDFRVVEGPTHTNILFDVVIPFDSTKKPEEVIKYLRDEYKKIGEQYFLVIKVDRLYI